MKNIVKKNKIKALADENKAIRRFALDLTRVLLATDIILQKNKDAFKATITEDFRKAEFDTILEVYNKIRDDLVLDT